MCVPIHYPCVTIKSWEHQDKQLVMPILQLGAIKLLQMKIAECDENMAFMFILPINLRNVIASSSLHTFRLC